MSLPRIVDRAPEGAPKLLIPGTKANDPQSASTSRAPWVDANGWRFLRNPAAEYLYADLPPSRLALAAAEAFAHGGRAAIVAAGSAQRQLDPMLRFLQSIEERDLPRVADIFVRDDGSALLGEVLNLLSRRNLLWVTGTQPPPQAKLTVELGTPEFPKAKAANPSDFAQLVRQKLTDARRSLRIYGSETIMGRLTGTPSTARLHLLNYATDPIEAFRIRLLGSWKVDRLRSFADPKIAADEFEYYDGGTEFGIDRVTTYAVIDLSAKSQ